MIPRVDLLALTEGQATQVRLAMQAIEDANTFLNALLKMVQPEGATGFDKSTMTFYTEPEIEKTE